MIRKFFLFISPVFSFCVLYEYKTNNDLRRKMDQYDQYRQIAELIAGEIRDTLNSDDRDTLRNWINQCEENRQLYYRLKSSSHFHNWRKAIEKIDARASWGELVPLIAEDRKKSFKLQILKYASVILLPFVIAGVVYYSLMERHIEQIQVAEQPGKEIQPGTSKAVLILNNGKTVTLDAKNELQLKETDGTTIEKTRGQLNYTPLAGKPVQKSLYNTIKIPRGGEYNLILADGTRVFLNAMSEFKYPVQFCKKARVVELSGEAYFDVTPSDIPFIVKTRDMKIKVLGTSFNVNAYENTGQVVTTLVRGKVRIEAKNPMGGNYILSPDEQAIFNTTDLHWDVKTVDASRYTSWKSGEFVFYDNRLEDIMNVLARWYSIDVEWEDPKMKDIRFSGSLNKYNNMNQILEIIQAINKIKIEVNNMTIVFKEV